MSCCEAAGSRRACHAAIRAKRSTGTPPALKDITLLGDPAMRRSPPCWTAPRAKITPLPSAGFRPLLEGLVELTEAAARVGHGPAGEGRQQATETLALNQPGATVAGGQREAVLTADDPWQACGPPQLDAGLGDDDLGLDGHHAAIGRVDAAQCDPVADRDLPGRLAKQRVPLRVATQVGKDRPDGHRRCTDPNPRRNDLHRLAPDSAAVGWTLGPGPGQAGFNGS